MYDAVTAAHYSAYRPPLHAVILERALQRTRNRETGLDIGSGTGCSARELARFCGSVIALEPSAAMLNNAENHDRVKLVNAPGECIPVASRAVDIVTLAGSLSYIDRNPLVSELVRVCRHDAEILVYDFLTDLEEAEQLLGINPVDSSPDYDHAANFRDRPELHEISSIQDEITIDTNPAELAHLLLSDHDCHDALSRKTGSPDPFEQVVRNLRSITELIPVRSKIFYSVYSLIV